MNQIKITRQRRKETDQSAAYWIFTISVNGEPPRKTIRPQAEFWTMDVRKALLEHSPAVVDYQEITE